MLLLLVILLCKTSNIDYKKHISIKYKAGTFSIKKQFQNNNFIQNIFMDYWNNENFLLLKQIILSPSPFKNQNQKVDFWVILLHPSP